MDLMAIRRSLMMQQMSRLPTEYQEVEYILATGNQYLLTDYIPKRYDSFKIDFAPTASSASYRSLISAGTGNYQLIILLTGNVTATSVNYLKYFSTGDAATFLSPMVIDQRYTMELKDDGTLYLDGQRLGNSPYGGQLDGNNVTLSIFRRRNYTSQYFGKLYFVEITNNGIKQMELIPCVRKSDSKPGMYDTVTKTFYTNAGTGEFSIPT